MMPPLPPELEQKAQELAARLQSRAADTLLDLARRLVQTTDATLFGDTEFALRETALGLIPAAYDELLKKKTTTLAPPATAPTAASPQASTTTAPKRSRRSAVPSPVPGPTTTAAPAAKAPVPGTATSD